MNEDPSAIFVFGSNLAGRHGAGAALHAKKYYAAQYGVGRGPTGRAYGIPTKDAELHSLSLTQIRHEVKGFLEYARHHTELYFYVTRIGCGLAGYTNKQIAPMFRGAPDNCEFDDAWEPYLI